MELFFLKFHLILDKNKSGSGSRSGSAILNCEDWSRMPLNCEIGRIWIPNADLKLCQLLWQFSSILPLPLLERLFEGLACFWVRWWEEFEFAKSCRIVGWTGLSETKHWESRIQGRAEDFVLMERRGNVAALLATRLLAFYLLQFTCVFPKTSPGILSWAAMGTGCTHGDGGSAESPPPQEAFKPELKWRNVRINFL